MHDEGGVGLAQTLQCGSITHRRARFGTDRFTVHPGATSVIVNV
ncbi:MAG TPA: hypothetical protein VLQ67_10335 [Arachnia sp.]|nr:hypothetical protein [Arachnia sp.]